MNTKIALENLVCRAAIEWERAHAERGPSVTPRAEDADTELAEAVHAYTVYLVQDALPVEGPADD